MTMGIKVVSVTIITSHGADQLYFQTELTPSTWPFNDSPSLRLDCGKGMAQQWLNENGFGELPVRWVNV
jgi:hypothetical protein